MKIKTKVIALLFLLSLNQSVFASCQNYFFSWFTMPRVRVQPINFSLSSCRYTMPTIRVVTPYVASALWSSYQRGNICSDCDNFQFNPCCCADPNCGSNPCLSCSGCCKAYGNVGADRGPCSYAGSDWDTFNSRGNCD